jgi:hypothetical protein
MTVQLQLLETISKPGFSYMICIIAATLSTFVLYWAYGYSKVLKVGLTPPCLSHLLIKSGGSGTTDYPFLDRVLRVWR